MTIALTKTACKGRTLTTGAQWITNGHWAIRRELLSPEQQALASAGLLGGSLGGEDKPATGTVIDERCDRWAKRDPEAAALQLANARTDQGGTPCVWFVAVDGGAAYAISEAHWKLLGKPERAALHLPGGGVRAGDNIPLLLEERGDKPSRWLCAPFDTKGSNYGGDIAKVASALARMQAEDDEEKEEE